MVSTEIVPLWFLLLPSFLHEGPPLAEYEATTSATWSQSVSWPAVMSFFREQPTSSTIPAPAYPFLDLTFGFSVLLCFQAAACFSH